MPTLFILLPLHLLIHQTVHSSIHSPSLYTKIKHTTPLITSSLCSSISLSTHSFLIPSSTHPFISPSILPYLYPFTHPSISYPCIDLPLPSNHLPIHSPIFISLPLPLLVCWFIGHLEDDRTIPRNTIDSLSLPLLQ